MFVVIRHIVLVCSRIFCQYMTVTLFDLSGVSLHSLAMTVSLTQEKKAKLKLPCVEALQKGHLVIRFVAQVINKIASFLPVCIIVTLNGKRFKPYIEVRVIMIASCTCYEADNDQRGEIAPRASRLHSETHGYGRRHYS